MQSAWGQLLSGVRQCRRSQVKDGLCSAGSLNMLISYRNVISLESNVLPSRSQKLLESTSQNLLRTQRHSCQHKFVVSKHWLNEFVNERRKPLDLTHVPGPQGLGPRGAEEGEGEANFIFFPRHKPSFVNRQVQFTSGTLPPPALASGAFLARPKPRNAWTHQGYSTPKCPPAFHAHLLSARILAACLWEGAQTEIRTRYEEPLTPQRWLQL